MATEKQLAQKAGTLLFSIFGRKGPNGKYTYSNEEAFDALLLLILQLDIDLKTAPDGIKKVVARFHEFAKLPKDASPEKVNGAIKAHFKKYPINRNLKREIESLSKDIGKSLSA